MAGLGGVWLVASLLGVRQPAVAATPVAGAETAWRTGTGNETSTDLLDLNTAAPEQLQALPGMGAAYARRILEGRPYTAKNQLLTRGVLPPTAYEAIRDRIVAHRPSRPAIVDVIKSGP